MPKPKLTPDQFYALRFSDELAIPDLIALGSKRKTVRIKQKPINLHSALADTPWCYFRTGTEVPMLVGG